MEKQEITQGTLDYLALLWDEQQQSREIPAINGYYDAVENVAAEGIVCKPVAEHRKYGTAVPVDWVVQMHLYWPTHQPDRMQILRSNDIKMAEQYHQRQWRQRVRAEVRASKLATPATNQVETAEIKKD